MNFIKSAFVICVYLVYSNLWASPADSKSDNVNFPDLKAKKNDENASAGQAKISATPRMVRENPVAQVFFRELTDSYTIPTTGTSYHIMNALYDGLRKKKPVSLTVDNKTKTIIGLDKQPVDENRPAYEGEDVYLIPTKVDNKKEKEDGKAEGIPPVPALFLNSGPKK